MTEFVVALTTVPADFDAAKLAEELISAGLAACVNILSPVKSVYRWQGAIQIDSEQQLLIKTAQSRTSELWSALKARHPYDVPEFVVLEIVEGNPDYLSWLRDSLQS